MGISDPTTLAFTRQEGKWREVFYLFANIFVISYLLFEESGHVKSFLDNVINAVVSFRTKLRLLEMDLTPNPSSLTARVRQFR